MSTEEAVAALDDIERGDQGGNHERAEGILLAVVPVEVAEAWRRAQIRDGGWWWA